jgi:hypothetical protein
MAGLIARSSSWSSALTFPFFSSTRKSTEGYIRRTILPGLGTLQLRKVRGPVLDGLINEYADSMKISDEFPGRTG